MDQKRIFGMVLALALLAGAFTLGLPQTAQACPSNEVTTTNYSDAAHTTVVGERILLCNCFGYYTWGVRTPYYTVDSLSCDIAGY